MNYEPEEDLSSICDRCGDPIGEFDGGPGPDDSVWSTCQLCPKCLSNPDLNLED